MLCGLALAPFSVMADSLVDNGLDDLIGLSAELVRDTVYPETEVTYILRVESRADIHFTRVNPPRAEGVNVRRGSQDHEYYFLGNEEFRISTYRFFVSSEHVGAIILEGASLTHVAVNENGTRRRVRNKANLVNLESRAIPDNYHGLWLPSDRVTLDQEWSTQASAIQVGDSISRTLSLYIQGRNIDSFPELTVDYPEGMNVYSEQPQFETTDGGMTMTLRQVIVPRAEGLFDIPSLAIPWFDTGNNTIAVASVKGLALNIQPNQVQTLALGEPQTEGGSEKYWRYATVVAVLLWLLTLQRLYRARKQLNGLGRAAVGSSKQDKCNLQVALEQRNHQAVVGAWGVAEPYVKKECGQLMDAYFAAFYSRSITDGEPERIAVLNHLKAMKLVKTKSADFAPIEP